jgi:aldehyde dehydrogenase (NAD+)
MTTQTDQMIDNRLSGADDAETFRIVNPATEDVIAEVPSASTADGDAAVAAARRAFPGWSATSRSERQDILRAVAAELDRRADEMAALICAEVGTPLKESRQLQVGLARHALQTTIAVLGSYDPDAYAEVVNSRVFREPVGVVAAISPWNYPLLLSMTKIAPALAAGCTVVHKPSEITPLNTLLLREIIAAAGVPDGVYNVVIGTGPTIGEALVRHPDVDMVAFTGSTRAGRRVYELASGTVKKINLELGGKSANLVLPDADLASAVAAGVRQVFFASGQACFAWSRLLVPRDRLADAEEVARATAESYRVGDPTDPATTLGPLVSRSQQERVRSYITQAVADGAVLITGGAGQPAVTPRGFYVRGTVLSNVTPSMSVAREEIFGPVVCLMPYDSEADAIRIANDSDYGLHGGVFSGDVDHATAVARQLRTGRVDINGASNNLSAPFGGYKQSGIGREFGRAGFEEYLETKAIQY